MGYLPPIPDLIPSATGETFGLRGWKVFVSGYWKTHLFNAERVRRMIATYHYLRESLGKSYAPKLRLGHDRLNRLLGSMGLPNIGRIIDLRPAMVPVGGVMTPGFEVDVDGIPCKTLTKDGHLFDLEAAIRNGQYDGGSIDVTPQIRDPLNPQNWLYDVFDGVALLGEEHPAIKVTSAPGEHMISATDGAPISIGFSFTEYEADPMPTIAEKKKRVADVMKMKDTDPVIMKMDEPTLDAFIDSMGQEGFAEHVQTMCGKPPVPNPAGGVTQQQFAELANRLAATEAANEDYRRMALGQKTNGIVTFSEASTRIDECVKAGRLNAELAEFKKAEAKDLLSFEPSKLCFSEGDHKGRARIAVFLEELERRPVDIMFSELIQDGSRNAEFDPMNPDPETRRIKSLTREGRDTLDDLDRMAGRPVAQRY